jgi:hypothetical protein
MLLAAASVTLLALSQDAKQDCRSAAEGIGLTLAQALGEQNHALATGPQFRAPVDKSPLAGDERLCSGAKAGT